MSRTLLKSLATSTVAISALALSPVASAATPVAGTDVAPKIIGGSPADTDATVQLRFGQGGSTYSCTGSVIAPQYVLTAKHCTEGIDWMDVYEGKETANPGPAIEVDETYESTSGDVAIVHLTKPANATPAKIADSYTATPGDTGTIEGYGARADGASSDRLYTANVEVLGDSLDAYYGTAVHIKGVDGAANHGDSGGPLRVNGEIVAVCSTGDTADPGSDINSSSNYANLTNHREWIRSVAGV